MSQAKTPEMLPGEYARSGLKRGLELEQKLGVNPYKFGQIGSTDSHTSLPAVEEDNFFGKHSGVEPSPERANHVTLGGENGKIMGYQMASSGYAAVWATENTREAHLGRDEAAGDLRHHGLADAGPLLRRLGVHGRGRHDPPPGRGRLHEGRPDGRGPAAGVLPASHRPSWSRRSRTPWAATSIASRSSRAGSGADGKAQERVYDVAVSDGRPIDANGRCKNAGRQHGRRRTGHLDQHDRRSGAHRGLDRSRLRSRASGPSTMPA